MDSLDCKMEPVNPKGKQSWIFIGRTGAEAPILWPPDAKSRLIWKDPDAGKVWRQEEKGMTEDEMVGWHHRLNGHEFDQTLGDGEGQGILACWSQWDHKESDVTEQLNNINTEMETGLWSQRNYKEANNTTWSQCVRYQMSDESKVLYGLKEE